MTTASAARRAAEGEKVGSFLDAVRRPDSRPGKLTPSTTPAGSGEEEDVGAEAREASGSGATASMVEAGPAGTGTLREGGDATGRVTTAGRVPSAGQVRPAEHMAIGAPRARSADAVPGAVAAPGSFIVGGRERVAASQAGRPPAGRQTETVIRTPATIDDVFTQLETPWELRDRQVLVRSYSMDPMTTEMLRELHELYGVDMSTLVRQSVKALYVEARRRKGRR